MLSLSVETFFFFKEKKKIGEKKWDPEVNSDPEIR